MVPIETAIGILGMLLILAAFAIEEFCRHSRHESVAYNVLNLVGAAFLAWYAWTLHSMPFLVLNVVWMAVALVKGVIILVGKRRKGRNVKG